MELCLLEKRFPISNPADEKVEGNKYSCQGHEAAAAQYNVVGKETLFQFKW